MPAPVLDERLGDRSGHSGVLRHRPHDLVLRAVQRHTTQRWVMLYVKQWLKAPAPTPRRAVGAARWVTPQGSAISPLLANLFMHYAFDVWMSRTYAQIRFERYCDDAVIHCATDTQAQQIRDALAARFTNVGLELHPTKPRLPTARKTDGARSGPARPWSSPLGVHLLSADDPEQAPANLLGSSRPSVGRQSKPSGERSDGGGWDAAPPWNSTRSHDGSTPSCPVGSTTTETSTSHSW